MRSILIALFCSFFFGCSHLGPHVINKDRIDYNQSLQHTDAKQILFNIVRARYIESSYFLQISNITGQYSLGAHTVGRGSWFWDNQLFRSRTLQAEAGADYRDSPTISYIPLESSGFVKLILQPIRLNEIYLMSYGDNKEIDALLRLVIKRIDTLVNIGSASFPDSQVMPQYERFDRFIDLIRALHLKNQLGYYYIEEGKDKHYSLYFAKQAVNTPEAREIRKLLRIPGTSPEIILTQQFEPPAGNAVYVQTRSVLGIISMLSHSVIVPEEHKRRGWVEVTRDNHGREFNWRRVMDEMMTIYSSKEAPKDAYVSIDYKGYHFFIKNSDLKSKLTLSIIQQFISMKSTYDEKEGPQLTLPLF
ncbi:hypothetical protein [Legionella jamestowniensis]|uniref:Lipoprotein n=1 Tax=Legionella jamestowniensis TaxID=455 RepID=A0A0W0UK63_9GAMM|nr:hypothetical protein [Legionella jamestowniensis]KTD08250.1 hypothetical protein Ljam_2445 [Legionella jamestowniensis]OCH98572.1 hypothetical protein A8135_00575 [Legionella jamestowniensis]SFL97864.1 hypothetical protein SAMN02746073_2849 [Legionella jamestowniensis DSM 19215]